MNSTAVRYWFGFHVSHSVLVNSPVDVFAEGLFSPGLLPMLYGVEFPVAIPNDGLPHMLTPFDFPKVVYIGMLN